MYRHGQEEEMGLYGSVKPISNAQNGQGIISNANEPTYKVSDTGEIHFEPTSISSEQKGLPAPDFSDVEAIKDFRNDLKAAGYVLPNSKGITFDGLIDTLNPEEMLNQWAKEAGWIDPAKDPFLRNFNTPKEADEFLDRWAKANGYVRLAGNQTYYWQPDDNADYLDREWVFQDMVEVKPDGTAFRKVILE